MSTNQESKAIQRDTSKSDPELCISFFLTFLFPLGSYFVWDISTQAKLLVVMVYVAIALLLSWVYWHVLARAKRSILKQEPHSGTLRDELHLRRLAGYTALFILVTFLGATTLLSFIFGAPPNALFIIFTLSVIYVSLFSVSCSVRYLCIAESYRNDHTRDGLKELLQAARTLFTTGGVLLVALVAAPAFSFGPILDTFGFNNEPGKAWGAILWLQSGLMLLGVSYLILLLARIVELHGVWLSQLDRMNEK